MNPKSDTDRLVIAAGLGKRFRLYRRPLMRACEWVLLGRVRLHQEFWALREVSFELQRGKVLGLLGVNGAGKTTLLRLLAGTLVPSEGRCEVRGQALALLGIGVGLNPSLSGRENVPLGAALLHFPASYAEEHMASIEAFADIGEFFDRPVWTYPTGMRARLGFALVSELRPDLLILDEAFGAGDAFFREKCFTRLADLVRNGTTVIMASHNLKIIQDHCDEVLLLEKGRLAFQGPTREGIERYRKADGAAPAGSHRTAT